jgi:hypothetical protein
MLGPNLMLWSEVAGQLGHEPAARLLLPTLAPHTARLEHDGVGTRGSYGHSAGILAATIGDLDSAEEYLGSALRLHERLGAPFFTARSMTELSRVLLRRKRPGDTERAEALLAESLDLAERHGCALVAARVRAMQEGRVGSPSAEF